MGLTRSRSEWTTLRLRFTRQLISIVSLKINELEPEDVCGIALIVSGVNVNLSNLIPSDNWPSTECHEQFFFSEEDIKAALRRRGPDSFGTSTVYINSKPLPAIANSSDYTVQSIIKNEEAVENGSTFCLHAEFRFIGATLQLRGDFPVVQPLMDASGNVLVYNGEIFGGLYVSWDSNDTEILMQSLGQCCSCVSHEDVRSCGFSGRNQQTVPDLLSRLKGPWALIYWQDSSKTLWFGRDALGRRSLLVHWPTCYDPRLLLSSVSPQFSTQRYYDIDDEKGNDILNFWEELPCGVYSICMSASRMDGRLKGEVRKHDWTVVELKELMAWDRISIMPKPERSSLSVNDMLPDISSRIVIDDIGCVQIAPLPSSHKVLAALRESVMRRTTSCRIYKTFPENHISVRYTPVAVLFSGGLDSMIIAALLHQCLESESPDRVSGRTGLKELISIGPSRRWNLVEIDADLPKLTSETKHVTNLINPAKTYMDLNIGLALWLAAKGHGRLHEEKTITNGRPVEYKSEARILLVGSGADEQCAGYGRHRTKFRNKSWAGLHEEMRLDMQRIWKRNLGRDDRCIADNGKEARFPFLDEDVIKTLLDIPLREIADLELPSGVGDKKILREVACLLGLHQAAVLPKRAIQFGSRIARESNKKNFGSNRAANQASAESVVIYNE